MSYEKKDIVDILIKRDGITKEEAEELVEMCQSDINAILNEDEDAEYDDPDDAVKDHLGLEPDYTMCFLD